MPKQTDILNPIIPAHSPDGRDNMNAFYDDIDDLCFGVGHVRN